MDENTKVTLPPPVLDSFPQVSIEELIKNAEGLSYVVRTSRIGENGKEEFSWQAVGSWGRSGIAVEGATIQEAITKLTEQPYHLHHELGRKVSIPTTPSDEDLLVRAIAMGKTEEALISEAHIKNIKYNWEERQALPITESWTVNGGGGKNSMTFHANSLGDALSKAWAFGILGIKKVGEDAEHYYLADYLPGLGHKHITQDDLGNTLLQTLVRKDDIHAMLRGEKEKMFQ